MAKIAPQVSVDVHLRQRPTTTLIVGGWVCVCACVCVSLRALDSHNQSKTNACLHTERKGVREGERERASRCQMEGKINVMNASYA